MNLALNSYVAAKSFFQKLHQGEEGMETVQIIMIMAVAAMVLTGVNQITGISSSGKTNGGGLIGAVTEGIGSLFDIGDGGFGLGGIGDLIGGLF